MARTSTIAFRSPAPVTDAVFRKELGCLRPADEEAEKVLRGIKMGECVTVSVKRPRNLQQLRLFWALMTNVWENQEHYKTPDEVCDAFKFAVGHYDVLRTKRGDEKVLRSIAFPAMDQTAFDAFFKRAVDFCVAEVIPGIGREELEREVLEMVR
jgi:hypothetical protein